MKNQNNIDPDKKLEDLLKNLIPFVVVIAALLFLIYIFAFYKLPIFENPSALGSFGDYIGGILNPIISFCTLLVAYSVWKLQKKEMAETKKALEDQAKTSERQRREQRFFDLLSLYSETVKGLVFQEKLHDSIRFHHGKSAFFHVMRQIPDGIELLSTKYKKSEKGEALFQKLETELWDGYLDSTSEWWLEVNEIFLPYFRVTLTILKELEDVLGEDHFRYAKLLRSQVTPNEACLLGYYLCLRENSEMLNNLVKKYAFLISALEAKSETVNFLMWHVGEEAFNFQ